MIIIVTANIVNLKGQYLFFYILYTLTYYNIKKNF